MMERPVEQLGRYTLRQRMDGFPLSRDTLALGAFATVKPRWRVCDLGTGCGSLLLLLANREPSLALTGVERDPQQSHTAQCNLADNGLAGHIITGDYGDATVLPTAAFDLVIANPPYFSADTGRSGGGYRCETLTVEELCALGARLLPQSGRFALCYRPERLSELLVAMTAHGIAPKRMQLLSHSTSHPPSTVLVEGVRGGGIGLDILPTDYIL